MDEQDLKTAWEKRNRRGWQCPAEADLAAYTDQRLEGRRKARLERHLAGCGYCLGQVSFLARAQEAELPEVPYVMLARARAMAPRAMPHAERRVWRWAPALAATASVIVVGGIWMSRPRGVYAPAAPAGVVQPVEEPAAPARPVTPAPERPLVRSTSDRAPQRWLLFPAKGAAVQRKDLEFRWQPAERALFYEVRLMAAEGELAWESRADGTQARVPEEIRLVPGRFYVTVHAFLPEGKTVRLPAVGFDLAP